MGDEVATLNDTKKPRGAATPGAMTHRKDVPMSNTNCTTTPPSEPTCDACARAIGDLKDAHAKLTETLLDCVDVLGMDEEKYADERDDYQHRILQQVRSAGLSVEYAIGLMQPKGANDASK